MAASNTTTTTVMNKLLLIGFNDTMKTLTDKVSATAAANLSNFNKRIKSFFGNTVPAYLMHPLRKITKENGGVKRRRDEDDSPSDVTDQTVVGSNKRIKTTHIEIIADSIATLNQSSANIQNDQSHNELAHEVLETSSTTKAAWDDYNIKEKTLPSEANQIDESSIELAEGVLETSLTTEVFQPIFRIKCFIGLEEYLAREKNMHIEAAADSFLKLHSTKKTQINQCCNELNRAVENILPTERELISRSNYFIEAVQIYQSSNVLAPGVPETSSTTNALPPLFRINCFIGWNQYVKSMKNLHIEAAADSFVKMSKKRIREANQSILQDNTLLGENQLDKRIKTTHLDDSDIDWSFEANQSTLKASTFLGESDDDSVEDLLNTNMDIIMHEEEDMKSWNTAFGDVRGW